MAGGGPVGRRPRDTDGAVLRRTAPAGSDAPSSVDARRRASPADAGSGARGRRRPPPARLVAYASGYGPDIQWLSVDAFDRGPRRRRAASPRSAPRPRFSPSTRRPSTSTRSTRTRPGRSGRTRSIPPPARSPSRTRSPPAATARPSSRSTAQGRWVFVANYTSGSVAVLPMKADGSLGARGRARVSRGRRGAHDGRRSVGPASSSFRARAPTTSRSTSSTRRRASSRRTRVPTGSRPPRAPGRATSRSTPTASVAYLVDETASTMSGAARSTRPPARSPSCRPSRPSRPGSPARTPPPRCTSTPRQWLFVNRGDDSIAAHARQCRQGFTSRRHDAPLRSTRRDFLYAANRAGNVAASASTPSAHAPRPPGPRRSPSQRLPPRRIHDAAEDLLRARCARTPGGAEDRRGRRDGDAERRGARRPRDGASARAHGVGSCSTAARLGHGQFSCCRAAQDVLRRELELLLGRDARRRVRLAREVVLHVVGGEEQRRVHVGVVAVAAHDDDGVRVAALRAARPPACRRPAR